MKYTWHRKAAGYRNSHFSSVYHTYYSVLRFFGRGFYFFLSDRLDVKAIVFLCISVILADLILLSMVCLCVCDAVHVSILWCILWLINFQLKHSNSVINFVNPMWNRRSKIKMKHTLWIDWLHQMSLCACVIFLLFYFLGLRFFFCTEVVYYSNNLYNKIRTPF